MLAPLAPLSLARADAPLSLPAHGSKPSLMKLPSPLEKSPLPLARTSSSFASLAPLGSGGLDTKKDQKDVSAMARPQLGSLPPKKSLHLASLNNSFFGEKEAEEEERSSAPSRLQRNGLEAIASTSDSFSIPAIKRGLRCLSATSMPVAKMLVPSPPKSPKDQNPSINPSPRTSRLRYIERLE